MGSFDWKAIRERMAFGAQDDRIARRSMKRWKIQFAVLMIIMAIISRAKGQDSDVQGTVRDMAGNPISEVSVFGLHHFLAGGHDEYRTKTDNRGHFELQAVGRPIFLFAQNYQPQTYIRGNQEFSLSLTLNPDKGDNSPPTCLKARGNSKRYGWPLRFSAPQGAKAHRVTSTDATSWAITLRNSEQAGVLIIESGPLIGGLPPEDWLLNSKEFRTKLDGTRLERSVYRG